MSTPIDDCVVVEEYSPRSELGIEAVDLYFNQLQNGVTFPPIIIQLEKNIIIDGRHRYEAYKKIGYEHIRIRYYDISEKDILPTAIKLNREHGLPLTKTDREALVVRLRVKNEYSFSLISKLVGLSYQGHGRYGKKVAVKSIPIMQVLISELKLVNKKNILRVESVAECRLTK